MRRAANYPLGSSSIRVRCSHITAHQTPLSLRDRCYASVEIAHTSRSRTSFHIALIQPSPACFRGRWTHGPLPCGPEVQMESHFCSYSTTLELEHSNHANYLSIFLLGLPAEKLLCTYVVGSCRSTVRTRSQCQQQQPLPYQMP